MNKEQYSKRKLHEYYKFKQISAFTVLARLDDIHLFVLKYNNKKS